MRAIGYLYLLAIYICGHRLYKLVDRRAVGYLYLWTCICPILVDRRGIGHIYLWTYIYMHTYRVNPIFVYIHRVNSSIGELSAVYICICVHAYATYSLIGELSAFYICGPTSYKLVDRRAVGYIYLWTCICPILVDGRGKIYLYLWTYIV